MLMTSLPISLLMRMSLLSKKILFRVTFKLSKNSKLNNNKLKKILKGLSLLRKIMLKLKIRSRELTTPLKLLLTWLSKLVTRMPLMQQRTQRTK
jgi:hypothetical protein